MGEYPVVHGKCNIGLKDPLRKFFGWPEVHCTQPLGHEGNHRQTSGSVDSPGFVWFPTQASYA